MLNDAFNRCPKEWAQAVVRSDWSSAKDKLLEANQYSQHPFLQPALASTLQAMVSDQEQLQQLSAADQQRAFDAIQTVGIHCDSTAISNAPAIRMEKVGQATKTLKQLLGAKSYLYLAGIQIEAELHASLGGKRFLALTKEARKGFKDLAGPGATSFAALHAARRYAQALQQGNQFQAAHDVLSTAIREASALPEPLHFMAMRLHWLAGMNAATLGRMDDALNHYEQGHELFQKLYVARSPAQLDILLTQARLCRQQITLGGLDTAVRHCCDRANTSKPNSSRNQDA